MRVLGRMRHRVVESDLTLVCTVFNTRFPGSRSCDLGLTSPPDHFCAVRLYTSDSNNCHMGCTRRMIFLAFLGAGTSRVLFICSSCVVLVCAVFPISSY